jgi:Protein of unknown function (DUF2971)
MTAFDIKYPALDFRDPISSSWSEELCRELEEQFQDGQLTWAEMKIGEDGIRYPEYRHLYKYKSVDVMYPERTETIFTQKRLWAASLDRFNDPLEAAFVVCASLAETDLAILLNSVARSNWWGCVSLSSDPVCVQMWAHYAAQHSGICIEYRRADSFLLTSRNCQPMSYRGTMPLVEAIDDSIHHVFWSKFDAWEYEREWRLMYPRANAYLARGLLVPSGVIFGLRTTTETKQWVKTWAPDVRFGQIISTKTPYRLQIRWEDQPDGG